ncbi:MAG: penicillin-binding protein activator [Alphaproteobacteria bacterium]|nr:penicillin-binding protein activator [Alphaproteobacteria bacterium]
MFKKISFMILTLCLAGCGQMAGQRQHVTYGAPSVYEPYEVEDFERGGFDKDTFKVAMILPLSGKASTFGKGLQNAAMMALEDTHNRKLQVRFYDTKSSAQGAADAIAEAFNNDVELVLGPLMLEEVSAVADIARHKRIPLISFSASPQVLGGGVYTLGLLSNEQINRIISYAAQKGRRKIAVVVADTDAGLNIAKSAFDAAGANGVEITKIGFFEPSSLEFSELIQEMIKTNDFDTVLIAETGNRLKAIAGTFGYYDVAYPDVLFIGTSVWENTNLTKETTLFKGVYPSIARVHQDYFNKKYKDLFGEMPNPLYVYAYDGVALASALSTKRGRDLHEAIEDEDGYIGINGTFRLFSDGTNEHTLDIVEVDPSGLKVVNSAPRKFGPRNVNMNGVSSSRPEIYGKNPEVVYQKLMPVQKTPSYFYLF